MARLTSKRRPCRALGRIPTWARHERDKSSDNPILSNSHPPATANKAIHSLKIGGGLQNQPEHHFVILACFACLIARQSKYKWNQPWHLPSQGHDMYLLLTYTGLHHTAIYSPHFMFSDIFKLFLVFTFIKRSDMPTEDANSSGHLVQSILVLGNVFSQIFVVLWVIEHFMILRCKTWYTDKKVSRSTCLLPYTYDESWFVFDSYFSIPSMNEMFNSQAYQILIERTSCKSSWQRPDKKFNPITPITYLCRYMYIIYTYMYYSSM